MYVSVQTTSGRKYVFLMERFSIGKGRTSSRIVKSLGRLDKLLAEDPMALEKLKKQFSDDRQKKKNIECLNRIEEYNRQISIDSSSVQSLVPSPELNYGFYPIRKLWNDELILFRKFNYIQKKYTKRDYDINRAILYLVAHKIIDPESILSSFHDKENFLGDPARGISLPQMYDAYSVIDEYKDDVFGYINRKLDGLYGENRTILIFYDVTNVYFESPLTDAEKNYVRADYTINLQKKAEEERRNHRLDDSCFDANGIVDEDKLPDWFWEEVKREGLKFFLMRGPSKEHRNDLPLASVALVIDNNGFPMDFEIYAGNVSEFKSMRNSIASLKAKYNIGGAIVVADRGLNSLGNLQMLLDSQLGFLVAQKVTQFDAELTKRMLDLNLYSPIDQNKPDTGFYQVIPNWKKKGISSPDSRDISCTLVLTYNESRRKRDEAILNSWVEVVEKKVKDGASLGKRKSGWATIAQTEKSSEQRILGVDRAALKRKMKTCGFAAVVFREPPSSEKFSFPVMTGADIARLYHRLNNIEECFRIMKSNLGLRPVNVRTYSHVRGHIAICVLALLIIRMIQRKLQSLSFDLSIFKICEALRDSKVAASRSGGKVTLFHTVSKLARSPEERVDETTGEILPLREEDVLAAYPAAAILRACGLTPLPRSSSHQSLGLNLGTRFPAVEDAVPACHLKQL